MDRRIENLWDATFDPKFEVSDAVSPGKIYLILPRRVLAPQCAAPDGSIIPAVMETEEEWGKRCAVLVNVGFPMRSPEPESSDTIAERERCARAAQQEADENVPGEDRSALRILAKIRGGE